MKDFNKILCNRCGGKVEEFSIPNHIWNAVIRTEGKERDDEYICHDCWERAKSVALAHLCGWEYSDSMCHLSGPYDHGVIYFDPDPFDGESPSLYDTNNMILAWKVLNWSMLDSGGGQVRILRPMSVGVFVTTLATEMNHYFKEAQLWFLDPEDAQTTWLDKILELAIEGKAGESQ